MLTPELSFVLHTADPLASGDGKPDAKSLYAELAPGMGETLASGAEGSAWRLSVSKSDSNVKLHAFANFSEAYMPAGGGSASKPEPGTSLYKTTADRQAAASASGHKDQPSMPGTVALRTIDYSKQELSCNEDARSKLAVQLSGIGCALEDHFGAAQDVEGAVVEGAVYVVQSRPQP